MCGAFRPLLTAVAGTGLTAVHAPGPGPDGNHLYSNRAVLMVRTAWGKIRSQEGYEDTERVAACDASHPTTAALDSQ